MKLAKPVKLAKTETLVHFVKSFRPYNMKSSIRFPIILFGVFLVCLITFAEGTKDEVKQAQKLGRKVPKLEVNLFETTI